MNSSLILVLSFVLMTSVTIDAQDILPDGIFLVIATDTDTTAAAFDGTTHTVKYDYAIVDSVSQSSRYLTIARDIYVPLVLAKAPDRIIEEDDRSRLFLTLTRKAGRQLKKMTGKYTGYRIALVIGEKAVTMHKIREPIKGNGFQITRCTDNACEHLFFKLRDNIR